MILRDARSLSADGAEKLVAVVGEARHCRVRSGGTVSAAKNGGA